MEEAFISSKETDAKIITERLLDSTGITLNGSAPWDLKVYNENFYSRVIREGALGLGESYMEKWWDCDRLDIFFDKLLRAGINRKAHIPLKFKIKCILATLINLQTKLRAKQVATKHYDLGNDLFHAMLDHYMNYSCGYWLNAQTLEEAQINKLDLICRKLELQPGQKLLDIGCGWGGLAQFAAERYGVSVVGVTISEQQYEHAKVRCQHLPVEIRLQDYRNIHPQEKYDRIVSVGMFEHVGRLNYRTFMNIAHQALTENGLFLLHTIGSNETYALANEWTVKYIFPNGVLPSIAQIGEAAEKLFVMEDWHSFGQYYDNTLMAWHRNFLSAWDSLKHQYDERFFRMWNYYLLSCAGGFRSRITQLWQIVFSKNGITNGYIAPR